MPNDEFVEPSYANVFHESDEDAHNDNMDDTEEPQTETPRPRIVTHDDESYFDDSQSHEGKFALAHICKNVTLVTCESC